MGPTKNDLQALVGAVAVSLARHYDALAERRTQKNATKHAYDLAYSLDLFDDSIREKALYDTIIACAHYAGLPRPPLNVANSEDIILSSASLVARLGVGKSGELTDAIRAVQKKYEPDIVEFEEANTALNDLSSAGTLDISKIAVIPLSYYAKTMCQMYNFVLDWLATPPAERKQFKIFDREAGRKRVLHEPHMAKFEGNEEAILLLSPDLGWVETMFKKAFASL